MHHLSEIEAQAILSKPTVCPDIGPWEPTKAQPDTWSCSSGLVDVDGIRVGCVVELLRNQSRKTRLVRYKLSVFKQTPGFLQRVYQLDITKWPRLPADHHQWPHEHVGALRIDGDAGWLRWQYHDALAHFTSRTNITFRPPIDDPEVFVLKG